MNKKTLALIILVLVNLVWNLFLYLNPDKHTVANYLFNFTYGLIFLLGAIISAWGSFTSDLKTNLGKGLLCYATALGSYSIAQFIWTYYNVFLKSPIPYPGLPDLFFIPFAPISAIGFTFVLFSLGGKLTTRIILEGTLVLGAIFAVLFSFLNQSNVSQELTLSVKILNIFYVLMDSLLVTLAITGIRTEKGNFRPNLLIFVFASLFLVIGDTEFSYRSAVGTYWNGGIPDTLFMISGSLYTLGIISLLPKASPTPNPLISSASPDTAK